MREMFCMRCVGMGRGERDAEIGAQRIGCGDWGPNQKDRGEAITPTSGNIGKVIGNGERTMGSK